MFRKILPLFFLLPLAAPAQLSADATTAAAAAAVPDSLPVDTLYGTLSARLDQLLADEAFSRSQVALCVYDLTADSFLYRHNEAQTLRPASCQKLVTAVAALSQLGGGYSLRTGLLYEGSVADSTLTGTLFVRGGMDPCFDRDDMQAFIGAVAALGVDSLDGDICLDLTFKDTARLGWGWCWDDKNPTLTPLLYEGRDRFAEALTRALADGGIRWSGTLRTGRTPAQAVPLCQRSHSIDTVLRPMLKQSNNLYAETLFYQLAAQGGTPHASRRQAAAAVARLESSLGLAPDLYLTADGSGLSLYNYASAQLLTALLRHAWTDEAVRRHLLPALPLAGHDGTLRKRMRTGTANGNIRAKTGTLEGVSTLCGYADSANGHTLCFAIFNNGVRHTRTATDFQDRVCQELTR